MSNDLSPIAATARLETATETLAEYIGYLNAQIHEEQQTGEPNAGRIEALENEIETVVLERRAITPDNLLMINRALYIYAPLLKRMRG